MSRGFQTLLALTVAGCASSPTQPPPPEVSAPEASESARLNAFFEEVFQRQLSRSPIFQTILGIKTDYDKWDDFSDAFARESHELDIADLERLRTFDKSALSADALLSYRIFEYGLEQDIEGFQWRFHNYPVNQMFGAQSRMPAFMINFHRVESAADAEAYIARLKGAPTALEQLEDQLRIRQDKGIIPPAFVFPHVLRDCANVLTGAPFSEGEDSTLLRDFKSKVGALELTDDEKSALVARATEALVKDVKPAYESLVALLEAQQKLATTDDGVWKLPRGSEFYEYQLRVITTTDISAEEVHALGLAEVARIHQEMAEIMAKVGFEGTLKEFFTFTRLDPQFFYPNTDEGRQAYLDRATAIIDGMRQRLDELFITKPKAPLVVKRVEPYREQSAGKAFYNPPTPDGSRPGVYYANLHDMSEMPIYQMEALAYHEAIPGHHMQIALAQEQQDLPKFRRFGNFTAYTEGWGLYSEAIPKEMGLYANPYQDFGRLAMEIWRACRLVVDTGIHARKWTREQAIAYLDLNTPNPRGAAIKAIERYIVMPAQATAYKIGMLRILELRARAREKLGDAFDLRKFHDVVLTTGAVPLNVLETVVDEWIERELASR